MVSCEMKENTLIIRMEGKINAGNAPQFEEEVLKALEGIDDQTKIVFDAGRLEYISSAGLRVFMSVIKDSEEPVQIVEVSRDLYEILEVTGFTELMDVKKALREISVDGCRMIGSGGYGKVYRIDQETIVKIYSPDVTRDFVDRERENSRKAFVLGIPTAIPFDIVKSGNSFGVIYELLEAKTVAEVISSDRERVGEMGMRTGKLLRSIHDIHPDMESGLKQEKSLIMKWVDRLDNFLEEADVKKIRDFVEAIPDADSFLHGDFHAKNIMLKDDEFQLIDVGDATIGHPVFDIGEVMLAYVILPKSSFRSAEEKKGFLGFELDDTEKMWGSFCMAYFNIGPEKVEAMTRRLMPYAMLMLTNQAMRRGGFESEEAMKMRVENILKPQLLPMIEHAEKAQDIWG